MRSTIRASCPHAFATKGRATARRRRARRWEDVQGVRGCRQRARLLREILVRFVELMVWGEAEEFVALLLHPLLAMTGARGRGQISAFSI
jgi:hypothetical protein